MILEVSGLTKWWHRLRGIDVRIALDNTSIGIVNNGISSQISINDVEQISIHKGLLSSDLVIMASETKPLIFKGYRSNQLNEFKNNFIQALLAFVASSEKWKAFEKSLENRKNKDVYLSSYEWQPLAQLHQLVTRFLDLGINPELLKTDTQRAVFKQAQTLSKNDVSELGRELHNQNVVPVLVDKYKGFFDTVEKLPLTEKQRIACVTNDDHNLVIAGAGTGKTSTLVGKAGFLIEAGIAKPKNILMLAFGNKAAAEMNERIQERIPDVASDIRASTFHALGNDIVANTFGYKKSVTAFAEQPHLFSKFIDSTIEKIAEENSDYKALLVHYFSSLGTPAKSELDFQSIDDYHEFLSSCRLITLKGEWVKSVGELRIANFLTLNGISYEYEAHYKFDTRSISRRQYQPDFYLPEAELYIEYLGLNENNETAPFVDQDRYLEDLAWKRELHKSKGTKMAELYSYQLMQGSLSKCLAEVLEENEIALKPMPLNDIFEQLRKENETQWSGFIELLQRFLGLFKEGNFSIEYLKQSLNPALYDIERTNAFLNIFQPIFEGYQKQLKDTDCVDFSDMIALAVDIVEEGNFHHSYTHILVDEFQDISGGRVKLLKAILASSTNIRLFAVGDDWQSIYRFNGADIALFTEFNQAFSPSTAIPLDKTFRFNNKIHNVSSQFVMANPGQIKKDIVTHSQVDVPALRLVDIKQAVENSSLSIREQKLCAYQQSLIRSLNTFNKSGQQKDKKHTVLIIGRYKQENMQMLKGFKINKGQFPYLDINYVTAHASKGLEADFVVVLGVESGSFPSSKENDELIDLVLPHKESYLYAEERRLFYVALTRAKHFIYILFDSDQGSPFLVEINKYGNKLIDNKLASSFAKWHCPSCDSGTLKAIQTKHNRVFYKCSLAPACDATLKACKHCNSPMHVDTKGFRYCIGCGEIEIGCVRCGIGTMVARLENDPNRETFYGCNRFRRGATDSCGENIKVEAFERRYKEAKVQLSKMH
ncbi:UvrD-helicase domain-containing protein [Pseudoalteromonas sp. 2CM36K]|uniref:UvrD-helicase domain-containing protein n=1 Tax=Pseudoalteromonas sp. 2CM36K TaxID=2929854 RepID=UPI0020BDB6BD|nr:UvrD-helicase domain-containing protein [Pseudoalteromonas sp. 2CM36K]MCK8102402.1 UvrD-helicase domain-containing protein [Pseudoalteromonas sp. 2CM36K]